VQVTPHDLTVFLGRCAKGDADARQEFQERYGALIYTFPQRIYRVSVEEAGDFYLYVFEQGRIFRRIKSFEGRNAIQFETYLSYYVLRDLFLEWMRTRERLDIVSLDAPIGNSEASGERTITMQEMLAAEKPEPEAALVTSADVKAVEEILQQLDPERRLILKLLALNVVELEPEDVRTIAQSAGRSILETLKVIEEVTEALSAKTFKAQEKQETLQTVGYWILTYQRKIAELVENIRIGRLQGETGSWERWQPEKAELERKLAWRYQQQRKLREELQKSDVRPSYKDIARILNAPLGTICSKIARAREEFGQKLAMARDERV
jgi:RNA polymerase sigma factor (sigma-70 family)